MHPLVHIILGLLFAVLLKLLTSFTILQIAIILLAAVFIDVDHWFVYVLKKKSFSIRGSYEWFIEISKKKTHPVFLCIFHTIEFMLFLVWLSFKFMFFELVLVGFIFHIALDVIDSVRKHEYGKEISLIYAVLRRK